MAGGGGSDGVDPGGLIELAEFVSVRGEERVGGELGGGGSREAEAPSEEDHDGPEGVAGIFAERCWEEASGHLSREQTEGDGGDDGYGEGEATRP